MPLERLPRSTPEAQGLPSRAVLDLVDALEKTVDEPHSLMVVVGGHVVTEGWWAPYEPHLSHQLYSLSKSFTSTAVGLAQGEGLLSVEDLVLPYFPDEAPADPDARLRALRIRHLLTMTTGHDQDPTDAVIGGPDWARAFLAEPLQHEPGTVFTYNTAATYVLSAIVQKVTGQRLLDYLTPRLLEPLGIQGATWEQSPQGVDTGGFGLTARTEDIACFGRLYLDDGVWDGRRLLPEGWVAEATGHLVPSRGEAIDWVQGYGYQFWRARHGYRGDGAFGQFCIVLPEQHTVVAMTAGVQDMQIVLDGIWEHLLPALSGSALPEDPAALSGSALPEDPAAHRALTERLARLTLNPPPDTAEPTDRVPLAGRAFDLDANELGITRVSFRGEPDRMRIDVAGHEGTTTIDAGAGAWLPGSVPGRQWGMLPSMASGAWTASDTYVVTMRLITTPYVLTLTARVAGDALRVTADLNVSFGPTRVAELTGSVMSS